MQGVQVFSNSGVLAIDADYQNLCYVGQMRISDMANITSEYTNSRESVTSIKAYGGRMPAPVNINSLCVAVVEMLGGEYVSASAFPTDGYIDVHAFADNQKIPNRVFVFANVRIRDDNFGLEIFNANGDIVFDSDNRYLRILPVPAGRRFGLMFTQCDIILKYLTFCGPDQRGLAVFTAVMFNCSAGGAINRSQREATLTPAPPTDWNNPNLQRDLSLVRNPLIVDLTGL